MPEDGDGDTKSRRQRLLGRFGRNRNGEDEAAKAVADFLKPSNDKATRLPRINVAVAQRFPAAQGLPSRDGPIQPHDDVNGLRKRRRREGLVVRFVDSVPEVIGEGGDEAPHPPVEYRRARSGPYAGDQVSRLPYEQQRHGQHRYTEHAVAGAERHADFQPEQNQEPSLPDLITPPRLEEPRRNTSSPLVADKGRAMRVNEGMALRRGSAYMDDFNDDDDNDLNDDNDPPPHFQPHDGALAPPFPRRPLDNQHFQHARSRSADMRSQQVNLDVPIRRPTQAHPQQRQPLSAASSTASDQSPTYPGQSQYQAYRPPVQQSSTQQRSRTSTQALPGASNVTLPAVPRQFKPPRPSSASSAGSAGRSADSTHPRAQTSQSELALTDFATRVAHMKGVFALTAERERPAEQCTSEAWLRVACWWYIEGKIELEHALRHRARSVDSPRELLLQGHVDLAKAWWILTNLSAHLEHDRSLTEEYETLLNHLQSLCLSIGKSRIMPPPASLIQGQDTRIWLEYPRLDDHTVALLSGKPQHSHHTPAMLLPTQALPLADSASIFCYNRFRTHVGIGRYNSSNKQTLPCMLSVVRDTRTFQNSLIVASQNEFVSLVIGASSGAVDWDDVEWHVKGNVLAFRADEHNPVSIYMQDQDFRLLRSMIDYTRKAVDMLQPEPGESLTFRQQVSGVRYNDASKSRIFPRDRVKDCQVCVFEREEEAGLNRRLAVVTSPSTKILSCVTHNIIVDGAVTYETFAKQDGTELPAMMLFLHDGGRHAEVQLDFVDMSSMHDFCAGISGCQPLMKAQAIPLAGSSLEVLSEQASLQSKPDPLKVLQWLNVTTVELAPTSTPDAFSNDSSSAHRRLAMAHSGGYLLAGLDDAPDVLFTLSGTSLQMLSSHYTSTSASLDRRLIHPGLNEAITHLLHDLHGHWSVRTFEFQAEHDMHRFQSAVTHTSILFDSTASSLIVARRKMGLPIKYPATGARIQLLHDTTASTYIITAFMPDFELAEAMCFEIRPTDTFEQTKGDSKGKKWSVKLADVQFALPQKSGEEDLFGQTRKRFVSLADVKKSNEHGDITVSFDSEAECDVFTKALPAAAKVSRLMTLRKRN